MKLLGLLGKTPQGLAIKAGVAVVLFAVATGAYFGLRAYHISIGERRCQDRHAQVALDAEREQRDKEAKADQAKEQRDEEIERKYDGEQKKIYLADVSGVAPLRDCLGADLTGIIDDSLRKQRDAHDPAPVQP